MSCEISTLEWRRLTSANAEALARFFGDLSDRDRAAFHPHPFTKEVIAEICSYPGQDLYASLFDQEKILAYGMLRGWDAGYEIPSLGIVVHPATRGSGIGRSIMGLLHATARRRGAKRIRLTVDAGNGSAINLYKSMGYQLGDSGPDTLVGYLSLDPR